MGEMGERKARRLSRAERETDNDAVETIGRDTDNDAFRIVSIDTIYTDRNADRNEDNGGNGAVSAQSK